MHNPALGQHISRRFDADLENVRNSVLQMGAAVEAQVDAAVRALMESDSELGARAAREDHKINAMEVAIDAECRRVLATRSPIASDLRLVIAIIKTSADLERIGDEGQKVAHIAARLATMEQPADHYRGVKHLARLALQAVHDALSAFARLDAEGAFEVCRRDRLLDEEYDAIQRQSITFMMEDPRTIKRVLEVMWIVRALERIGDHAKNICEYIIYMVHGKDVRHTRLEDVEKTLRGEQDERRPNSPT